MFERARAHCVTEIGTFSQLVSRHIIGLVTRGLDRDGLYSVVTVWTEQALVTGRDTERKQASWAGVSNAFASSAGLHRDLGTRGDTVVDVRPRHLRLSVYSVLPTGHATA